MAIETTFEGYTISGTMNDGNLWAGDEDGFDVAASQERYYDLLTEALEAEFPGVTVQIAVNHNTVGWERGLELSDPNGTEDEDGTRWVSEIVQRVYVAGEWYVEA